MLTLPPQNTRRRDVPKITGTGADRYAAAGHSSTGSDRSAAAATSGVRSSSRRRALFEL